MYIPELVSKACLEQVTYMGSTIQVPIGKTSVKLVMSNGINFEIFKKSFLKKAIERAMTNLRVNYNEVPDDQIPLIDISFAYIARNNMFEVYTRYNPNEDCYYITITKEV